jgi:hypothetical protein
MADDTMEISSDHGLNDDDDIDLDIDFTTGVVDEIGDEDYMVDETPVDTGYEQNEINIDDVAMFDETAVGEHSIDQGPAIDMTISFEEDNTFAGPIGSLEVPGTSMMMDDNTSSTPGLGEDENMLAADVLNDLVGNHLVQTAADQDSTFDKDSGNSVQGQEPAVLNNSARSTTPHAMSSQAAIISAEQTTSQPQEIMSEGQTNASVGDGSSHPHANLDESKAAITQHLDNAESLKMEQPVNGVEVVRNGSLNAHEKEAEASDAFINGENMANDEHGDPAEGSRNSLTPTLQGSLPTEVLDSQDNVAEEDVTKGYPITNGPDIVVAWQSNEYSLFPKSESDDPDSFFLSDLEIIERPLGEFLQSMRSVISEELQDEDELCMAIGDLGLEFEEVCHLL